MENSQLARDGGAPVRTEPLPSVMNASGRRFGDDEVKAVERVLRSGMLSATWGTEVPALELEFASLLGAGHAVACSSGTAALHLAVAAVNPEPGDEIITTPISDMGTVFPIMMQNAVPVFADVDPITGNLTPQTVAAAITPRTKAVIVVHLFGKPAAVRELRELCDRHGILLIEDCAQAYLAPVGDSYVGRIGHIGISAVTIAEIERARSVAPIAAVQNEYSLVSRAHDDEVDHCAAEGIVFVPYFPLRGEDPPAVAEVAEAHGATPSQIRLAWLMRRSPTIVTIPGTLSLEHLKENLAALEIELDDADFEALR